MHQYGTDFKPNLYPRMLVALCMTGVRIRRAMTYGLMEDWKNMVSWNNKAVVPNIPIANGKVSNRGARDDISPSRFRPLRLLMNDPALSPIIQAKPSMNPIMKADAHPSSK